MMRSMKVVLIKTASEVVRVVSKRHIVVLFGDMRRLEPPHHFRGVTKMVLLPSPRIPAEQGGRLLQTRDADLLSPQEILCDFLRVRHAVRDVVAPSFEV